MIMVFFGCHDNLVGTLEVSVKCHCSCTFSWIIPVTTKTTTEQCIVFYIMVTIAPTQALYQRLTGGARHLLDKVLPMLYMQYIT